MKIKFNEKKMKKLVGSSLVLMMGLPMVACSEKSNCNIKEYHAHKYVNPKNGMIRYIDKEYLEYEDYEWQEDYKVLENGDKDKMKYIDKKDLLAIKDNLDLIENITKKHEDFIAYEYSYEYTVSVPHVIKVGKTYVTSYSHHKKIGYSLTRNPEHENLTGKQIQCHYMYEAYRIKRNNKGKYELVSSGLVDNLAKVMKEYPYINENFYTILDVKNEQIDYKMQLDLEEELENVNALKLQKK